VEFVQLGFPEMLPAFANKNIEASQFQEPFTTLAINQGLIVRGPIGYDMYPFQQIGVVAVGPKLVNDRDLSVRFLRAYTRGVRDYVKGLIQKDPATFDQVVPILIEHTAVKERALFEKAIPSGLKADPLPNVQSIVDDQDYFVASGVVQQKIDMSKYIDLSMIEQVIKELGPAK
jgi:NitT/TauT family transport system substrate-binding protein